MSEGKFTFLLIAIIFALIGQQISLSEARYLPTRSQEDRLVKLKELLQDVSNRFSIYTYVIIF